jgi:hypothetical protein
LSRNVELDGLQPSLAAGAGRRGSSRRASVGGHHDVADPDAGGGGHLLGLADEDAGIGRRRSASESGVISTVDLGIRDAVVRDAHDHVAGSSFSGISNLKSPSKSASASSDRTMTFSSLWPPPA